MQPIVKYFWQICLLRAGPDRLPSQPFFVAVVLTLFLITNLIDASLSATAPFASSLASYHSHKVRHSSGSNVPPGVVQELSRTFLRNLFGPFGNGYTLAGHSITLFPTGAVHGKHQPGHVFTVDLVGLFRLGTGGRRLHLSPRSKHQHPAGIGRGICCAPTHRCYLHTVFP